MSDVTLAEELRRLHCRSHHPSEPVSLAVNAIDKLRERVSALEDGRADGEPDRQDLFLEYLGRARDAEREVDRLRRRNNQLDLELGGVRTQLERDNAQLAERLTRAEEHVANVTADAERRLADAYAEQTRLANIAKELVGGLARAEGERDAVIARARLENQACERIAGQALQEKGNEMACKCVAQSRQLRAEVERDAARELLAKYEALELAVARWRLDLGSSREITSAHEDLQQALDGES